jgi:hypothetical protein
VFLICSLFPGNLSADDLEDLGEALFDFSEIDDLVTWLNQKVSN